MISFLPLNQLITIMSFAASVIVHCILTIIIYYHFDNKKNLIIKNNNNEKEKILVAPKKKKSNYMNKTEVLNKKKEDIKKLSRLSTPIQKVTEDKINDSKKISQHAVIENNNKLKKKNINKQKDYKNPKVEKQSIYKNDEKITSILKKSTPNKEIKTLDKVDESEEIKKKNSNKTESNKSNENNNTKALEDYKNYLKQIIQKEAAENYPRVSIRKREEGKVEIIFSLNQQCEIKEIKIGSKTDASKRIINSLIKILKKKIDNFEKNEILKKTNTFSIIIVYKLR